MALLDHLRTNRKKLLEDERDLILDTYDECILLWDEMTAEEYYESTFINQKGE